MDPPHLPSHPPTTTAVPAAATTITTHLSHPDSANCSPRSRHVDTWDESLAHVPGAKLRLMCSYGGHIIPRPHDKSLCYIGGVTRMVVIDRHSSLFDLSSRLSCTLLNSRHFTLKYQLPNEELDSLISVTTNEDLENMIEEYDRITPTTPLKTARLRLFLFLAKPETAASMGSLLDDAKSETWFVDALNGAGLLPRGLSDSATMDCLLELESHHGVESQNEFLDNNKQGVKVKIVQDVNSTMPDSPMVETNSSFGSSSSTPSMSTLPSIKVRVEDSGDQMVGLDEAFSHMTVVHSVQKQDDGLVLLSAPSPLPPPLMVAATTVSAVSGDDERSDQGVPPPTGFRKPPLPLQTVQRKVVDAYNLPSPDSKLAGGFNLHSPDSVASDSSIASSTSLSKHTVYQESSHHVTTTENRVPPSIPIDPKANISDPSSQIPLQQVHDSSHLLPPQQIQQQYEFVHANKHYIHHPTVTGQVPISSYYQMCAPPPSQQQQLHHQIDQQQYPMYFLPVSQTQFTQQPYNLSMQPNVADTTVSRPPCPSNSQPIYPTKLEMAANVYKTGATTIGGNQFQQQYVSVVPQMHHHPSQSLVGSTTANYGYKCPPHPTHDQQVYYATQYQTMTPATAVLLSQASAQVPADNTTT
ncbi:hypothetical protein CsSME_00006510 [Camellia sinensis var. sinensis]